MERPLIIYHSPCLDGFTAAWVAKKKYPDAELFPGVSRQVPPDVTGRNVIIVDFSYSAEIIEDLFSKAKTLSLIDHHKSAEKALKHLPYCHFDMTRSGAGLAWDTLFPEEPRPWLVNYIEDRDMWRWCLTKSKEVSAALDNYDLTLENWDLISQRSPESLADEGNVLIRFRDASVQRVIKDGAREVEFEGYKILVANCPMMQSEIGNQLAQGRPFAVVWRQKLDGSYTYSLRSAVGGIDVSTIAEKYGGGGHAQASGFNTSHFLFK